LLNLICLVLRKKRIRENNNMKERKFSDLNYSMLKSWREDNLLEFTNKKITAKQYLKKDKRLELAIKKEEKKLDKFFK